MSYIILTSEVKRALHKTKVSNIIEYQTLDFWKIGRHN